MSLSPKVFQWGAGGKLVPVEVIPEVIGQKVIQANKQEVGVICKCEMGGYTVIFPDGSSSNGQQFQSLSPLTRIAPVAPLEVVSVEEVAALLALSVKYRNDSAEAARIASEKKSIEKANFVEQLRKEYPKAKQGKASANLKAELTAKFPGVKFSVRGDHSSVNVKYTDGPALADVEAIANKYQDGHFDGMQDIHEYDHSAYGQAFDVVCGRVKYVFVERSYSRESMLAAADLSESRYGHAMTVEVSSYDNHAYIATGWQHRHQHNDIYSLLRATDLRF